MAETVESLVFQEMCNHFQKQLDDVTSTFPSIANNPAVIERTKAIDKIISSARKNALKLLNNNENEFAGSEIDEPDGFIITSRSSPNELYDTDIWSNFTNAGHYQELLTLAFACYEWALAMHKNDEKKNGREYISKANHYLSMWHAVFLYVDTVKLNEKFVNKIEAEAINEENRKLSKRKHREKFNSHMKDKKEEKTLKDVKKKLTDLLIDLKPESGWPDEINIIETTKDILWNFVKENNLKIDTTNAGTDIRNNKKLKQENFEGTLRRWLLKDPEIKSIYLKNSIRTRNNNFK